MPVGMRAFAPQCSSLSPQVHGSVMSLLRVSLAPSREGGGGWSRRRPCSPSCWPVQPSRSSVPTLSEFRVKGGRWLGKELRNLEAWVQILPQLSMAWWSCSLFILSKPLFPMQSGDN